MHQTARLAYPYQVSMNENPPTPQSNIDLVGIEQDLADVEIALSRLEAGTYWTCEVTGNDIPDSVLEQRPTSRVANRPWERLSY